MASSNTQRLSLSQPVVVLEEGVADMPGVPASLAWVNHLHRLETEREAAYRQMQRMVSDLGMLRNGQIKHLDAERRAVCESMFRLALAVRLRSGGSVADIKRQGVMAALVADAIGCDGAFCDCIQAAMPLKDVGMIGLSDALLQLADEEAMEVEAWRNHTRVGAQLLADSAVPEIRMAAELALSHHERFDGQGFPAGLTGCAIPLSGRIAAVIDEFDRQLGLGGGAITPIEAAALTIETSGTRFDPLVIGAFATIRECLPQVCRELDAQGTTPPEPRSWRRFRD